MRRPSQRELVRILNVPELAIYPGKAFAIAEDGDEVPAGYIAVAVIGSGAVEFVKDAAIPRPTPRSMIGDEVELLDPPVLGPFKLKIDGDAKVVLINVRKLFVGRQR